MDTMRNDSLELTNLFATTSLGAPENAVGFVLWRVFHRYQREIDRALAPCDLTHLQFTTLALAGWQGRSGEQVIQSTLARSGDMHPMQLSLMLKALEAKGLILRKQNPSDVRAKCIRLTAAGRATLRRALPAVIEVQQQMFGEQGRKGGSFLRTLLKIDVAGALSSLARSETSDG
jgi:DNA-binding MarR family transcriptional regulator